LADVHRLEVIHCVAEFLGVVDGKHRPISACVDQAGDLDFLVGFESDQRK
jgi:hypothetical protein